MNKPKAQTLTIRIPDDLKAELERRAKLEGRSLSNIIKKILHDHVYGVEEDVEETSK
jgi:predicted DNA-binding protein